MKKQRNIQNLKPFKKGQSGNPKGRPRKIPEIDDLLGSVLGLETSGITQAEHILKSMLKQARKGNVRAAEILLNRAYGLPKQKVELEGTLGIVWQEQKTYETK